MKNVKCKLCINYRNEWCSRVFDSPDPDMLRDCQYFSHMTNADRIRAMTDEHLSEFLSKLGMQSFRAKDQNDIWTDAAWLNWLKQRVSE